MTNTVFGNNVGDALGSQTTNFGVGHWRIINCTVSNKLGTTGTGIGMRVFTLGDAELDIRAVHSVFWGNAGVGIDASGEGVRITASHSDIDDTNVLSPAVYTTGVGMIDADPQYVNTAANDFRLSAGSPAIDSGSGADDLPTDFEGKSRGYDGDGNGAVTGDGSEVDMGADEFGGTPGGGGGGGVDLCTSACRNTSRDTDGDGVTNCAECELDLNEDNSDGDGLPDGFEVDFGLNPLANDAASDPDENGLTNLEELLAGSDPTDATSPQLIFFVAKTGSDVLETGSAGSPWASIDFALGQVPATSSNPVRINVFEGEYTENIVLRTGVTVASALDNVVVIRGTVVGANGSSLIGVELTAVGARKGALQPLLDLNNVSMHVKAVLFRGTTSRTTTGILAD